MDKQQRYDELEAKFDNGTISREEITESVNLWYEITGEPRLQPIEGIEVQIVAIPNNPNESEIR